MNHITVQSKENSVKISISSLPDNRTPYEKLRDSVRAETNINVRLSVGNLSTVLRLPYVTKDMDEALENFSTTPTVKVITAEGIPSFVTESCLMDEITLDDLSLLNEMILECHGLGDFERLRWERQAYVLNVDNLTDMTTVFDSSLMLGYFSDLNKLGCFLARTFDDTSRCPYSYVQTQKGVLLYTAGNPTMIELMNRKANW